MDSNPLVATNSTPLVRKTQGSVKKTMGHRSLTANCSKSMRRAGPVAASNAARSPKVTIVALANAIRQRVSSWQAERALSTFVPSDAPCFARQRQESCDSRHRFRLTQGNRTARKVNPAALESSIISLHLKKFDNSALNFRCPLLISLRTRS
jgi:hypothetical protein